jgi:hypothetical protein
MAYWLAQQFDQGNSTSLAPMGLVMRSAQVNQYGVKLASFRFFKSFVDGCNSSVRKGRTYSDDETGCIRMNIPAMCKLAGVESATFKLALTHLFRRISEVLRHGEAVSLDFSIGTLVSEPHPASASASAAATATTLSPSGALVTPAPGAVLDFIFHEYSSVDPPAKTLDPRLLAKAKHTPAKATPTSLQPVAAPPSPSPSPSPLSPLTAALRQRYTLPHTTASGASAALVQKLLLPAVSGSGSGSAGAGAGAGAGAEEAKGGSGSGSGSGSGGSMASPRAPRTLVGASHLSRVRQLIEQKRGIRLLSSCVCCCALCTALHSFPISSNGLCVVVCALLCCAVLCCAVLCCAVL